MNRNNVLKVETIAEFHKIFGLNAPFHPLVSLVNLDKVIWEPGTLSQFFILNFYKISYKTNLSGRIKYGQSYYDFGEGGLMFTAPGQVVQSPDHHGTKGYVLVVHPDFLLSYPLSRKIKQYGFFSYSANEALHLSEEEKSTTISVMKSIEQELMCRIDEFSQDVIISQIELLLNYSNRFYKRQFITRKAVNTDLLERIEVVLNDYFNNDKSLNQGLPSVHFLADQLNLSPSYLSDMLRSTTGQNAQQIIHEKLIEKAKEKLSSTNLTVSEIAYELGFEHPQSFSKLFKTKTKTSPLEFRQLFN